MSKYISSKQVALAVALMLQRSGKTRARMSEKTLLRISNRRVLKAGFILNVKQELEEREIWMGELRRGGFAIAAIEALSGAPMISARKLLTPDEIKSIKQNRIDADAWEEEASPEPDWEEEED